MEVRFLMAVVALKWARYVSLDTTQQKDLAKAIGTSVEIILDNLLQLDLMSTLF